MIKAPRDEVFQAWTDYEAWPRFSVVYPRVAVAERAGDKVSLAMQVKVRHGHVVGIDHPRGRAATRTELHTLTPPDRIKVTADTDGTLSTAVWTFEPVSEGTFVTADVHAPVHGPAILMGSVARHSLQSLLRQELEAFAGYVETRPGNRAMGAAPLS